MKETKLCGTGGGICKNVSRDPTTITTFIALRSLVHYLVYFMALYLLCIWLSHSFSGEGQLFYLSLHSQHVAQHLTIGVLQKGSSQSDPRMLKSLIWNGMEQSIRSALHICGFPPRDQKYCFPSAVDQICRCKSWGFRGLTEYLLKKILVQVGPCSSNPCYSRVNCTHHFTHGPINRKHSAFCFQLLNYNIGDCLILHSSYFPNKLLRIYCRSLLIFFK